MELVLRKNLLPKLVTDYRTVIKTEDCHPPWGGRGDKKKKNHQLHYESRTQKEKYQCTQKVLWID